MSEAPSSTALLVASGVAFQSTHPRFGHLVPDHAGELARSFVAGPRGSSFIDRFLVAIKERLTVPGLTLHYVLRKRWIEKLVRSAIASDYRQLIVLGAGLDTLSIRLANEIVAIEIDQIATQRLKRNVAGAEAEVEFVAADLAREPLAAALTRSSRYRPDESAVFLAEAVFLYLTESQVRSVLRQLRERHAPTRLIFTFWSPRNPVNFQNATPIADWWLRLKSEPGQWTIEPDRVAAFLASEGFSLVELVLDREYHEGYRAARGEHIAVSSRT
jgi:methyltransferase (TIGR00027 family)